VKAMRPSSIAETMARLGHTKRSMRLQPQKLSALFLLQRANFFLAWPDG
jgi:hypothetical protein